MEQLKTSNLDSLDGLNFQNSELVQHGIGEHPIQSLEEKIEHNKEQDKSMDKLSSINFTDLFLSEDGNAFIRGSDEGDGPLSNIPESTIDDLSKLHSKVCEEGENKIDFFVDYDGMRFRVNKMEEANGVWYALRRLPWPIPKLLDLRGVPLRTIEYLGYLGKPTLNSHGLILIAGATSQGKTTTASALLTEYLSHYGDVAVTIEDPIELPLSGPHGRFGYCFQTSVDDDDFKGAMKKTMRRAPRYIYLGEIRSGEEASVALRAALTGHLVISTIHAGNCVEAIDGMIKYVTSSGESSEIARQNLASGLLAVFHQRLIKSRNIKGKMLQVESLFISPNQADQSVRNLIRSGKTEQLSTIIQQQATRIKSDQSPIL